MLARDVRDLLAAEELATATYRLLERAAQHAGDASTADLAQQMHASQRSADQQLSAALGSALQITLLAE